jgi:hypothetical protein
MKRFYGTHHDQIARMKQLEESQKNSEARERLRELKKLKDQKLEWYKIRDTDPDLYKRMKKLNN